MSELVCGNCANTGYVAWEGPPEDRRPVVFSSHIELDPEKPEHFTCLKCGTRQPIR